MNNLKKRSDEEILRSYERLGSVWRDADELGMCGQVIYRRLKKMGKVHHIHYLTDDDKAKIEKFYRDGFEWGSGELDRFAQSIGRTKQTISRYAKSVGLTTRDRVVSEIAREKNGKRTSQFWKEHGHPRGMLGKHHTVEVKKRLSETSIRFWDSLSVSEKGEINMRGMMTKLKKYGSLVVPRPQATWKAGWRTIGGVRKYYRSKWEANYARYLEFIRLHGQIRGWRHEPTTFWFDKIKRGCRSYLPDFEVTLNNGEIVYHEVKGWYDSRSKTKLKRMKKYHPDVKVRVIFSKEYHTLERQLRGLIRTWE